MIRLEPDSLIRIDTTGAPAGVERSIKIVCPMKAIEQILLLLLRRSTLLTAAAKSPKCVSAVRCMAPNGANACRAPSPDCTDWATRPVNANKTSRKRAYPGGQDWKSPTLNPEHLERRSIDSEVKENSPTRCSSTNKQIDHLKSRKLFVLLLEVKNILILTHKNLYKWSQLSTLWIFSKQAKVFLLSKNSAKVLL